MNGTSDIPILANVANPERPCGLTSIIPSLGMSSCRGRAEAFARRLQSKLRTLGSQSDESPTNEDDPIVNNDTSSSSWISTQNAAQTVTNLQPLRANVESFFDFDCELESPGSPADECEYSRLIETATNTPSGTSLTTGFVLGSSPTKHPNADSIHSSSSEDPYYDPEISENGEQRSLTTGDYFDCEDATKLSESSEQIGLTNGFNHEHTTKQDENNTDIVQNGKNETESLLPQNNCNVSPTTKSASSLTETHTIQDKVLNELHQQSNDLIAIQNGHHEIEKNDNWSPSHITNGHNDSSSSQCSVLPKQIVTAPSEDNVSTQREIKRAESEKHLSAALDTEDEDDCRPQRVRRCSSLKTGKTPPGTPGRKKIVRFADVLGLDLADVKTFLDEIPNIPKSAFEDLEIIESEPPIQLGPKPNKLLMPLFQQPAGLPLFLDVVREKQVSLENAAISDHINLTITGSVRVRNLDFHKSVHIRYTLDGWRSFADLQANYVKNSCDGFSDIFTFVLFGNSMVVGQRLEFAVRFQCKGQQFWDNNYGTNYCFQCLPATSQMNNNRPPSSVETSHHSGNSNAILSPGAGEAWCGSFY